MVNTYGRDELVWSELVDETERFLVERARMARSTSYTELNAALEQRTGHPRFNFDLDAERAAIGSVRGKVALRSLAVDGFMLSAIVIYLNANDADEGFYRLAEQQGLIQSGAPKELKDRFWSSQVSAAFEHYRRPAW